MSQRCTASPTSAPASPAAPSRVQKTLELVVFRCPLFTTSSRPNVQIAELPTPRSAAAVSAGPRWPSAGAVWGVLTDAVTGWCRPVAAHTPAVARTVNTAKHSQAKRHWWANSNVTGPETRTPAPVPALTTACARGRPGAVTACVMRATMAGDARPAPLPATRTPAANTPAEGATAMAVQPSAANTPARPAAPRARPRPSRRCAATAAPQ